MHPIHLLYTFSSLTPVVDTSYTRQQIHDMQIEPMEFEEPNTTPHIIFRHHFTGSARQLSLEFQYFPQKQQPNADGLE